MLRLRPEIHQRSDPIVRWHDPRKDFPFDFGSEMVGEMATTKERFEAIENRLSAIDGPQGRLQSIERGIPRSKTDRQHFWPKTLAEWATVIGLFSTVLGATAGVVWYVGELAVDKHIGTALDPIN